MFRKLPKITSTSAEVSICVLNIEANSEVFY